MGIELIGIEKSWHKVPVLQQVSFRTAPGETLVLLGPSGAGKSSLLRMMNLLDTPDAGVLRIADSEFSFPSSLSAAEFNRQAQALRRKVGMVFARPVVLPFSIRRNIGLWKLMFLRSGWVLQDAPTPELERGRYIVEALAHCAECHTPRNALGGLDRSRWMAGAPSPDGKGRIPNITPGKLTWSEAEIFAYLTTGFTPEFDSVGGHMAYVVENMSKLPESDVHAVVAYLKALPPLE